MSLTYTTDIQFIPGIGPERAKALHTIKIFTVRNLLEHFPRKYLDRSRVVKIGNLPKVEGHVTVIGKVIKSDMVKNRGKGKERLSIALQDETGTMELIFFQGIHYMKKVFAEGESFAVFGDPQRFGYKYSLVHPEYDHLQVEDGDLNLINTGGIVPLYPSSDNLKRVGFDSRGFRRILSTVLEKLDWSTVPESIPFLLREKYSVSDYPESVRVIHQPKNNTELNAAIYRLKIDEILYFHLQLAIRKIQFQKNEKGLKFLSEDKYTKQFFTNLPFKLTEAQINVLRDIRQDIRKENPMNRLIQGDVGSGKTVVAIMAMLMAVDNGFQAAFMAPTEILAEQHYKTLETYIKPLGLEIVLLTGSLKSAQRTTGLGMMQSGLAQIAVGTHALIEDEVYFQKLGMVVIDEQHRFGVVQRAKLRQKGQSPHVLIMTATPIPRTLSMTIYGDLDVSKMNMLPFGRIPITTKLIFDKDRPRLVKFLKEELQSNRQIYFVYPLVEESEKLDLKAATDAYEEIKREFPDYKVGLLHGRMKSDEKDDTMRRFKANEIQIMVATTVIEVGVDVPNATVMVIEHAERFGLSQLHQLRGRVGRGSTQSYCFLLASVKISTEARQRLSIMVETTDGFRIAEEDMKIRGTGDIYGTRQSGLPDLKLLDLVEDFDVVSKAKDIALEIVNDDPHLRKPEHKVLRNKILSEENKLFLYNEVG